MSEHPAISLAMLAGIIDENYDASVWNESLIAFYTKTQEPLLATISRLNMKVLDLQDQLEYHQGLVEREECHRCHVKEIEFPKRIKKVTEALRARIAELENK